VLTYILESYILFIAGQGNQQIGTVTKAFNKAKKP